MNNEFNLKEKIKENKELVENKSLQLLNQERIIQE